MSSMSSVLLEEKTLTRTSLEATLHMWQTAATVVATDPIASRKAAYEQAIDFVAGQLPPFATVQDLANQFWQTELQAVATVASLRATGKILNHQVVAGAACWRKVADQLSAAMLATDDHADELGADL